MRIATILVFGFFLTISCTRENKNTENSSRENSTTNISVSENATEVLAEPKTEEEPWDCVDNLINEKYRGNMVKVLEILNSDCDFSNSKAELKEILIWAVKRGLNSIVQKVIGMGISPDTRVGENGMPILARAAIDGRKSMVDFLLTKRASVDEVYSSDFEDCTICPDRITVLHHLVIFSCRQQQFDALEIFEPLIAQSSNVHKENGQGYSIFEMAEHCENDKLKEGLSRIRSTLR